MKKLILGAIVAACVFLLLRRLKYSEGFISTEYSASCTQLCNISNPNACTSNPNGQECKKFHKCVEDCRADQANIKSSWDGPYGKLL